MAGRRFSWPLPGLRDNTRTTASAVAAVQLQRMATQPEAAAVAAVAVPRSVKRQERLWNGCWLVEPGRACRLRWRTVGRPQNCAWSRAIRTVRCASCKSSGALPKHGADCWRLRRPGRTESVSSRRTQRMRWRTLQRVPTRTAWQQAQRRAPPVLRAAIPTAPRASGGASSSRRRASAKRWLRLPVHALLRQRRWPWKTPWRRYTGS